MAIPFTSYPSHGIDSIDLQNRFSNYHLIDAVFQGANILLAHFHHVSKGYAPFSVDWESGDTIVLAKSSEVEIRYMKEVIQATKHQGMS